MRESYETMAAIMQADKHYFCWKYSWSSCNLQSLQITLGYYL